MSNPRIKNFERECRIRRGSDDTEETGNDFASQLTEQGEQVSSFSAGVSANPALVAPTFSDVDSRKYWNIFQRLVSAEDASSHKFGVNEEDYRNPSLQILSRCKYFKKKGESTLPPPIVKTEVDDGSLDAQMNIYDAINSAAALDLAPNGYVYSLRHLCLSGRGLDVISLQCNFCNLQSLDISDNEIESTKLIGALPYLKYFIASKNAIQAFLELRPPPIALSVVDFSCNNISSFVNLKEFWTLTKINLSNNFISSLENFASLKHLHSLNLSNNKISALCPLLLPSLLVLDLSWNSIDKICGLEKCKNLRYFNIAGNMIDDLLPIRFMTELVELNVSGNQINDIASIECLKTMIEITDLTIHSNPLTKVENARILLIHMFPQLIRLDGSQVTPKEMQVAKDVFNPSFRKLAFLDQVDMIVTQASQHSDIAVDRFRNFQKLPPIVLLVGSPRSRRHRLAVLLKEKFRDKICLGGLHCVPLVSEEFPRDLDIPISIDSFNEMKTKGEFLATAKVLGHACGFASSQVARACAKGAVLVAAVSLPTAITLRNLNFRPKIALVLPTEPPSFPDLDKKIATLIKANQENEEVSEDTDKVSSEEREHRISFDTELSMIPLEDVAQKIQKFIDEVVETKQLNDVKVDEGPEEEDSAALQTILKQARFDSKKSLEETKVIFAIDKQSIDSIIDAESTFFPKAKDDEVPTLQSENPLSIHESRAVDSLQVEVGDDSETRGVGEAWMDDLFGEDGIEDDALDLEDNDDNGEDVKDARKEYLEAMRSKGLSAGKVGARIDEQSHIINDSTPSDEPEPLHDLRKPPYSLPDKMNKVERLASILMLQTDVAVRRSLNIYDLLMTLPLIDAKDIDEAEQLLLSPEWKMRILQNRLCNDILDLDQARCIVLEKLNVIKEGQEKQTSAESYPREKFIPPNFSILQGPCPVITFSIGHEEFIRNYKLLVIKEERLRHKKERHLQGLRGRFSVDGEDSTLTTTGTGTGSRSQTQLSKHLELISATQSLDDKVGKSSGVLLSGRQTKALATAALVREDPEEQKSTRCILPANVFDTSEKTQNKPLQAEKPNYSKDFKRGTLAYDGLNIPLTESQRLETVPTEIPKPSKDYDYNEYDGEDNYFDEDGEVTDFISLFEAKDPLFNYDNDMENAGEGDGEEEGQGGEIMLVDENGIAIDEVKDTTTAKTNTSPDSGGGKKGLHFDENIHERTLSVGKYGKQGEENSKGSIKDAVKFELPAFHKSKRDPLQRKKTGFHHRVPVDDDDDDDDNNNGANSNEGDDDFDDDNDDGERFPSQDQDSDSARIPENEGENEEDDEEEEEDEEESPEQEEESHAEETEGGGKKRRSSQPKRTSMAPTHEPVKFDQSHDTLTPHRASYDPAGHKADLTKAILSIREQYVIFHQENPGFFTIVLDPSDICNTFETLVGLAQDCMDKHLNDMALQRASITSYGMFNQQDEDMFMKHRLTELKAHSQTWSKGLDKPSKVYTMRERNAEPFGEILFEKNKKLATNILDPTLPRPRFNQRMEKLIKTAQRMNNEKTKCAERHVDKEEAHVGHVEQPKLTCSEIYKGKPKPRPRWQDEIAEYECRQRERELSLKGKEADKDKALGFDGFYDKPGSHHRDHLQEDVCFDETRRINDPSCSSPLGGEVIQPFWKSELKWKPSYDKLIIENNFATGKMKTVECKLTAEGGLSECIFVADDHQSKQRAPPSPEDDYLIQCDQGRDGQLVNCKCLGDDDEVDDMEYVISQDIDYDQDYYLIREENDK